MLRYILFDTTLFDAQDDVAASRKNIMWVMESLVQRNQAYLKARPNTPRLYQSGVIYKLPAQMDGEVPEVSLLKQFLSPSGLRDNRVLDVLDKIQAVLGGERFRDIGRIIENGGGDCFPLTQKIIVRSKSTGMYELLALGELRLVYSHYEALSYNFRTCRYEFKDIIGFVDKGVKPVSKAHLSNGTDLIATDDHKFWSVDGTGVNARRIGTRTMGEFVETYLDFRKGKLSKNQRGARSRILQASSIPALDQIKVSESQAYLAGIYAAEGEFDGKHTRIGQHKPWVREKIEAALIEMQTSFSYSPGRGATPGSGAQYSVLGGASNPLVAMMRLQGLNSFDKRIPQALLSGDAGTVAKVIEGHGDGDAWRPENGAYKRPEMEAIYATSSDELMEQLRLGLLVLGRPTYAYKYEDHGGEGDGAIWRLHEYKQSDDASTLKKRQAQVEEEMGLPGMRYGTVRSAVPFGKAHVGCIEVQDNHNFLLADGTLASNCDNVACWRAAELRQAGIKARPYMTSRIRPDGGTTYHALVLWPPIPGANYVTSEDPSLLLGMGGPARAAERSEEIRKNAERCDLLRGKKPSATSPLSPADDPEIDALEGALGLRRPSRPRPEIDALEALLGLRKKRAA